MWVSQPDWLSGIQTYENSENVAMNPSWSTLVYNRSNWRGSGRRIDSQCGITDVSVEVYQMYLRRYTRCTCRGHMK